MNTPGSGSTFAQSVEPARTGVMPKHCTFRVEKSRKTRNSPCFLGSVKSVKPDLLWEITAERIAIRRQNQGARSESPSIRASQESWELIPGKWKVPWFLWVPRACELLNLPHILDNSRRKVRISGGIIGLFPELQLSTFPSGISLSQPGIQKVPRFLWDREVYQS